MDSDLMNLDMSVVGTSAVPGDGGGRRAGQHHVHKLVKVYPTVLVLVGLGKHDRELPVENVYFT